MAVLVFDRIEIHLSDNQVAQVTDQYQKDSLSAATMTKVSTWMGDFLLLNRLLEKRALARDRTHEAFCNHSTVSHSVTGQLYHPYAVGRLSDGLISGTFSSELLGESLFVCTVFSLRTAKLSSH